MLAAFRKMSSMQIHIRPAVEADMPAVHALVQELAFYEKAPQEVVATPQQYAQDFRERCFDCFIADAEGQVVGLAFYFMAYSTWKGKML